MTTANRSRIATQRFGTGVIIAIRPNVGTGAWTTIAALASPLVAVFIVIDRVYDAIVKTGLSWHAAGLIVAIILSFLFLGGILRMIVAVTWNSLGIEELSIDQGELTLSRVLGPVHCQRKFALAKVTNIRWRERRVVAKGASYLRRVVSFDVARESIDIGTQLSLADAVELERELRTAIDTIRRLK